MAAAGLSTLGITFGYGTEATAGTKPTSFKQLTRINSIGGINIEPEQIDASALEDANYQICKGARRYRRFIPYHGKPYRRHKRRVGSTYHGVQSAYRWEKNVV